MSTRAAYVFKDEYNEFAVYKHHDGYPDGAKESLAKALDFAWELPRFEADEFAAAFVAANKVGAHVALELSKGNKDYRHFVGGGVRLLQGNQIPDDVEYIYNITCKNGVLTVTGVNTWTKEAVESWTIEPPENNRQWMLIPKIT